jgi:hypothetical protein
MKRKDPDDSYENTEINGDFLNLAGPNSSGPVYPGPLAPMSSVSPAILVGGEWDGDDIKLHHGFERALMGAGG